MTLTPEYEYIKAQFDKVIIHSQEGIGEHPKTDTLFRQWAEKKDDIIQAFGGRLIYEFPENVTFELSEQMKKERVREFINTLYELGYLQLSEFVESQKEGFYTNRVIEEYIHNDIVITKGTKLLKAFKHFVSSEETLELVQNKASQILQENKINGKLCLSVHPLDYLSVSENTYNWRSCHALDGEYRAGNLSYMLDTSTIVCYLKGEDKVQLPHFPTDVPWNSKKWRVLLYISNDWKMMFAGRQYPFSSDSGMTMLNEVFNQLFTYKPGEDIYHRPVEGSYWSNWTDYSLANLKNAGISFTYYDKYIPVRDSIVSLEKLMTNGKGSKHYNDVLSSSYYTKPMYCYLVRPMTWYKDKVCYADSNTKFEIGGYTPCLRCGVEEVVDSCCTMMCYNCELEYGTSVNECFSFCSDCGARIETDTGYYYGDDIYCHNCFHANYAKCEECYDFYPKDEMYYDEVEDGYYCKECR